MKIIHTDEVASLTSMTPAEVGASVRKEGLPAYRLSGGRKLLFFLNEAQEWLDTREERDAKRLAE